MRRHTNPDKLYYAQVMRANPTPAEAMLRAYLCPPRFPGFRFQAELRGYIADCWCPSRRLVVELDGGYHDKPSQVEYDRHRDNALAKLGITTLRLRNEQILSDINGALAIIETKLRTMPMFRSWNAKRGMVSSARMITASAPHPQSQDPERKQDTLAGAGDGLRMENPAGESFDGVTSATKLRAL